jgi:hypothetical protein
MTRRIKFALAGVALFGVAAALAVWGSWSRIERFAAGVHQKSVTQELRMWEGEYASVTNDASAIAAAELVAYLSHYYVPGPGYRGPVEIEAALERQREATTKRITDALQRYTRLDYGTNPERWSAWAKLQKKQNSEPGSAANWGQPVGSETNRTPAAAGPGG